MTEQRLVQIVKTVELPTGFTLRVELDAEHVKADCRGFRAWKEKILRRVRDMRNQGATIHTCEVGDNGFVRVRIDTAAAQNELWELRQWLKTLGQELKDLHGKELEVERVVGSVTERGHYMLPEDMRQK